MQKFEFLCHTFAEVVRLLRRREHMRWRECDIPVGRLTVIILNMFRDKDEKPEPFTIEDLLPFLSEIPKPEEAEETYEQAYARVVRLMNKGIMLLS
jgi:hypothetical protein